jgi:hypothetical protein
MKKLQMTVNKQWAHDVPAISWLLTLLNPQMEEEKRISCTKQ